MTLLFALVLGIAFSACGGCGPEPADPVIDAGTDAGLEGCVVDFSYRPLSTANSVFLIGEWNGFDRQAYPLTGPDAAGTWAASFVVPPGFWAYAFLVDGGEKLDPKNSATRQIDGHSYSMLTRACAGEDWHSFLTEVRLLSGTAAIGDLRVEGTIRLPGDHVEPGYEPRSLTAEELSLSADGERARISLSGLEAGKYTVKLSVFEGDRRVNEILLPFWIEPETFSFPDSPLYMVLTDRFRDGDPANNQAVGGAVPHSADFQGGDLQGVEQSIREGYFDELGIRAIWLSPWQTQPSGSYPESGGTHHVTGYHGYWPIKAREVDPRLGGAEALHSMVEEAHRHGIRIIMDTVVNHVHEEHEYFQDPARRDWFRVDCVCGTEGCGWDEKALSCLFTDYMPDVNWTVDAAAEQMVSDVLWWVEEFDLDGLRVDAVKHVEDSAITRLATAMRSRFETAGTDYFMFGETFTDDYNLIKRYIGPAALDGQFDFPRFQQVPENVFANGSLGLQHAKWWVGQSIERFAGATMVTFIGSHDVPRFISKADPSNRGLVGNKWENLPGAPDGQEPYDRLWMASLHLMTTPGVPLLYYGDEYGEFGGSDPDNRHFKNQESTLWSEHRAQLERMRKLLKGRESLRGLARGPLMDLWCNSEWEGKGNLYAYARPDSDPHETAVVVLNLTSGTWGGVELNLPPELGWSSGTVYDVVSGNEWPLVDGKTTVDVPGLSGVVLGLR